MGTKAGYLGKATIGTDKIAELGAWSITGQEIDIVEDSQLGDTFKSYKSSQGDGGIVTFSGNYDSADTNGQIALLTLFASKESTNEIRLYFGSGFADFFYCKDTVTCNVQSVNIGTDQTGLGTIEFQLKVSHGWMRKADAAYDAVDGAGYACSIILSPFTMTKASGGSTFGALGFLAGQEITARGWTTAGNNKEYTIAGGGVADNVLTTVAAGVNAEGPLTTVRIIGKTV